MSTVSQETSPSEETRRRPVWLLLILGLVVVSLGIKLVTGTGVVPTLFGPVFILLLMGLVRILPPRFPALPLLAGKTRAQLLAEIRPLLAYALLFPILLIPVVIWGYFQNLPLFPDRTTNWAVSWNYLIVGKIVLLCLPTVYFVWRYGGSAQQLGLRGITNIWRWIAPVIILLLYTGLLSLNYLGTKAPGFSPWPVLAVILVTFLAAAFPEEFFYRVLLQTRLEALVGRWNGIAISSLFFGLLHLPSRFAFVWLGHTGNPALDLTLALKEVFVAQVVEGIFLGYLWARYRNAWINMLLHLIVDAIPLVLIVAGALLKVS
ncbi:MAG TPA: CPBP family intramembrane glutamic endopeptidase [Ktedonobacteraceae bacterium]|nr:CPBP family intramembrane glutamic endopeptidase [Ktedonobacteraceae bacterium]